MFKYLANQLKNLDKLFKPTLCKDNLKMSAEKKDFVNKSIKSDKVVIFSKSGCPFCKMAKECFDKLNCKYTAIELDKRDDTDEIQDILEEITGIRTVPQVFIHEKFLGGGMDTKKKFGSGELAKLVEG